MPLLIDSLKPFQPAEGDTVITTHSTEKRITQSTKGMLTVNKAAGPGQTLHLQHCVLAEAPPIPAEHSGVKNWCGFCLQASELSCMGQGQDLCSGHRERIAEPTVFLDSFSHAVLSLFLQVNVGQIFREHHSERRPSY